MRRCPSGGFAGRTDLEHGAADGTPESSFDEGEALVVNEQCAREHTNARALIEAMFDRERRLRSWEACIRRLLERNKVAARLICTEPVPGLALGHIVLRDVDQLFTLANLALRPIE